MLPAREKSKGHFKRAPHVHKVDVQMPRSDGVDGVQSNRRNPLGVETVVHVDLNAARHTHTRARAHKHTQTQSHSEKLAEGRFYLRTNTQACKPSP